MKEGQRSLLVLGMMLCLAAGGVAVAEETQDSPLYAYTLRMTLQRMETETTPAEPPATPGVFLPKPVELQAATSAPMGPTVCNPLKTVCPVHITKCPAREVTVCPQRTTQCPQYATQCPVAATSCPTLSTRCPSGATSCPLVRTQCPARNTVCPRQVATACPEKTTQCPAYATQCPVNVTLCPPRHTRCPAAVTECPLVSTQCPTHMTKCPSTVPTACPQRTTQCPVVQTLCPNVGTQCPANDTECPVRNTVCPPNCPPGTGMVSFTTPTGDPTTTNTAELSFDANVPGVCVVRCELVVNAPARPNIGNEIRVCIDPVTGSQLQWQSTAGVGSPWDGSPLGQPPNASPIMGKATNVAGVIQVSAIFTGMPTANTSFGPKTVYAQIVDGAGNVIAEAQQRIEIFYDRTATNNPGTGINTGPNWFYYWKTGAVVAGSPSDWQYEVMAGSFGYYMPGEDHVNVGDLAQDTNTGPETYTKDDTVTTITVTGVPDPAVPSGLGPYCCGETVAHENYHKWSYENYGPLINQAETDGEDDGDAYDDPDDDGIPNLIEPLAEFTGINGNQLTTDPNDPDTYNMGGTYALYGDEEMRCRAVELNIGFFGMTVDGTQDWSSPGWNTVPQYP